MTITLPTNLERVNATGIMTKKRSGSISSDYSSTSGSSDDLQVAVKKQQQRTRRRCRRRNKRSKRGGAQPVQPQLAPEEQARYVAMDCEMVGVGFGGKKSALARVTMIDWNGEVLMDDFVKPDRPVTDFRTFVSGITAEELDSGIDIDTCRSKVEAILSNNRILVGHALKNDLAVLGVRHPWYLTRDTAKYEPFMKVRFDDGVLWPKKLKELATEKLKRDIQAPGEPHCPYEDALTALDLYKTVRNKWEKVMTYKFNRTREIEQQHKVLQ